jgi:hypothetical protein
MKQTLVISDLHLGVSRSAGTTPQSAAALKAHLHAQFAKCLRTGPSRVIINGDLTDTYDIGLGDAIEVYAALDEFLSLSGGREVLLSCGNHDLSKDSSKLGTVSFIGRLLEMKYPGRFTLVDRPMETGDDIYIIPHVVNQAVFDMELARVPASAKYVLLHGNLDNPFAGQQDHSLNVTREQAKSLIDNGATVVFGHEHQGRKAFGGRLIVVGNQESSSVSDCLAHGDGQLDGKKYALILSTEGPALVQTWSQEDNFAQVDWRFITQWVGSEKFIRVNGNAEADEAADVIKAISAFRQKSDAFVVTNAVRVAQLVDTDNVEVSAEDVRSVNVVQLLLETLTEDQAAVVRTLMEEQE